jgi:outer membrane protein TolC
MQLGVSFETDRAKSSAGTAVEPLNYRSDVQLSVTQPILRGFSTDLAIPRIDILEARIASDHERQQLAVESAGVIEQTCDAYWDVVEDLYAYDLQVRSHKRAEDQLALTKRQIAAGTLPPSDIIAAQSTLAQRELGLVQAEEGIHAAWDQLRGVLHLAHDQWSRPILPTDVPSFAPRATSLEKALETAVAHRPELAQAALDIQAQGLAIRQADNNNLPQIDLGLSGGLVGQDAHFRGALHQVGSTDANELGVMLNLIWTPLNRTARANADLERARYRVARAQREALVQQIWLAVREAVRQQRSAARQVIAAAKSRALAEQTLDLEQRKFLNGTSSNFLVAQRQGEVAAAQLAELTAVLGHEKARAALLRATGRLLADHNVELGP